MVYAEYDFYQNVWHGGMPDTEFAKWAARAGLEIDRLTHGRAASAPQEMARALCLCCCELADALRAANDVDTATRGGVIASENVDGYDVSYRDQSAGSGHAMAADRQLDVHRGVRMNGVFNTGVTVYHREYDAEKKRGVWTAAYYPKARWHGASAATVGAQGESAADKAVIRLFTDETIPLAIGDMAVRGMARQAAESFAEIKELYPDSVKVLLVRDNRRGSAALRHWRIEGA